MARTTSVTAVKLGGTVATVGLPIIGLQGFALRLAKNEIASLSGPQDDAWYYQINVSCQRGSNSGRALMVESRNVGMMAVVAADQGRDA